MPCLKVTGTLIDPDGNEVGTHEHELLWHPMIYHYGRNWTVPADGEYTLKVHIEPPTFMRHDEINGCRFDGAGRRHVRGRQGRARAGLTRPAPLSASAYVAAPVTAAASSTEGHALSVSATTCDRTKAPM